jgi:hypothetical protein
MKRAGLAMLVAVAIATCVLALFGAGVRGTHAALAATARFAFLLFWPAYAGGAMASLFGPPFEVLRRYGRAFGLAFAAALTVHIGLLAWLCVIGAAPSSGTFLVFGTALALVYLLALFSIDRLRMWLGAHGWWLLRTVGMNYIAFAFAKDFLHTPFGGGARHVVEYAPFALLAVAGPAVRLGAYVKKTEESPYFLKKRSKKLLPFAVRTRS